MNQITPDLKMIDLRKFYNHFKAVAHMNSDAKDGELVAPLSKTQRLR